MSERNGPVPVLHVRAWLVRADQSLFLLPAAFIAAAAALAVAVDVGSSGIPESDLPASLRIGANSATTLLSTIAGATITTVGVVFSIVVLSVQLASAQFSPRVVRNFFADRRSQLTIGILAGTFTYCVLTLFSISRSTRDPNAVPLFAVGIAAVLGVTSILAIVSFLNHSAQRLYVGNLTERVTRETLSLIDKVTSSEEVGVGRGDGEGATLPTPADATVVPVPKSGWVQQVSWHALAEGVPDGSVVRFETRTGVFVVAGTPLAQVWLASQDPDQDPGQDLHETVQGAVVIGSERTMQQDIGLGLRQLSDIALRALSSSVNDPHTAIEVIHRHATILRRLIDADLPAPVYRHARVTVQRPHELSFGDYVEQAFTDIRPFSAQHLSVATAVVRTCAMLCDAAQERQRPELASEPRRQLRLVVDAAGQADWLPEDFAALRAAAGSPSDEPPG